VRAGSLDEALFACADLDHAWIIGGGQVYAEALRHPAVEVVELTRVWSTFPCDTFFGPLPDEFALDALSEPRSDADVTYVYERYARR
jgi:dihydrofolate reductase